MLWTVVLFTGFLLTNIESSIADSSDNPNSRIVGGVEASDSEFPHICSLESTFLFTSQHICGASVLNQLWLLTSATCASPPSLFTRHDVVCGRKDLSPTSVQLNQQRVRVRTTIRNPNYNATTGEHDIALLQLASRLIENLFVRRIDLPQQGAVPIGIASLIGWGGSESGFILTNLNRLQLARVPIFQAIICNAILTAHGIPFVGTAFCTGPITGGLSPCELDRGSSLVQGSGLSAVAIGVVSTQTPCGLPGFPGTYTQVSLYTNWIQSQIN